MAIDRLSAFFAAHGRQDGIVLAYLFGSRAAGTVGPLSDYDIAVLFDSEPQPERVYALAHKLSAATGVTPVELVPLNRAPPELRYAVVASGICLFERSRADRVEFEADTLRRYGDYLPILRQQREELLEEGDHEARVQRYRTALGEAERVLAQAGTARSA